MSARAIGVLLGLGAAAAFEVSYLVLAAQARRVTTALRPGASFLARLARLPWWLVAMGLNGVAFGLELVALRHVSLVVVQPLLAVGLLGLVLGARVFLGERVDARRVAGAALVAIGITLVVAGAPATGAASELRVDAWSVAMAVALLAALATNEVAAAWSHRLLVALGGVIAVAVCGLKSLTSSQLRCSGCPRPASGRSSAGHRYIASATGGLARPSAVAVGAGGGSPSGAGCGTRGRRGVLPRRHRRGSNDRRARTMSERQRAGLRRAWRPGPSPAGRR